MSDQLRWYSKTQIVLHWSTVALVIAQYVLHDSIVNAWELIQSGKSVSFDPLVLSHVAGGIFIALIVLIRLRLRSISTHETKDLLGNRLSNIAHKLLYAILLMMVLSGGMAWFFNIDAAANAHNLFKVLLLITVLGHVLAALYHHFIMKDGLLNRMFLARK
jgi:cytochrome b561